MLDAVPLPARCAARVTALPDHTHRRAHAKESSPAQAALSPRSWTYHVPKIIGKAVHTQRQSTACRGQLSPIICILRGHFPEWPFSRSAYSEHAVRWQGWIHVQTSKHSALFRYTAQNPNKQCSVQSTYTWASYPGMQDTANINQAVPGKVQWSVFCKESSLAGSNSSLEV